MKIVFSDRSNAVLLLWIIFVIYVPVPFSLVITCLERAGLMALLCVMFPHVFITFPNGVSGQVWYLIESILDLCLLLYFNVKI